MSIKFKSFTKFYDLKDDKVVDMNSFAFKDYSDEYVVPPNYLYMNGSIVNGIFVPSTNGKWIIQINTAPINTKDSIELTEKDSFEKYGEILRTVFKSNKYGIEKITPDDKISLVFCWCNENPDIEFAIVSGVKMFGLDSNTRKCKLLAVKGSKSIFESPPYEQIIRGNIDKYGIFTVNKDGEWAISNIDDEDILISYDSDDVIELIVNTQTVFNQYADIYNTVKFRTDGKFVYVVNNTTQNNDIVVYTF